jgi:hypothetical protein
VTGAARLAWNSGYTESEILAAVDKIRQRLTSLDIP